MKRDSPGLVLVAPVALVALVACAAGTSDNVDDAAAVDVPRIDDLGAVDPAFAAAVRRAVAKAEAGPPEAESFGDLGDVYWAHQYFELARISYEQAHALDPGVFRWPYFLGVFAQERGLDDEALTYFEAAGQIDAAYPPLHLRHGDLALARGDLHGASTAYRRFDELSPGRGSGKVGLARVALRESRLEEAAALLAAARNAEPTHREAAYLEARTLHRLGRHAEAERVFRSVDAEVGPAEPDDPLLDEVRRQRRDLQAVIQTANRALDEGQVERAGELYQTVLERDPDHFDANHNLGLVRGRQSRFAEAERLLRRAVAVRPESRAAHHNLALAYASQQKLEAAMDELRLALEIEPDHEPGRRMLEDLERHTGVRP